MKRILLILSLIYFCGCTENIWLDHDDPRVYIPKNGFSLNKAWLQGEPEYVIDLSVNCSGLRPENRKKEIYVDYSVDPGLIKAYNEDITQTYAGQIVELPSDCYQFMTERITIPEGRSHGELGIKINLVRMKELGLALDEIKYAIPIRLDGTSMYNLQENVQMLEAIYCITLDQPTFFFWDNRSVDENTIAQVVTYDAGNTEMELRITSEGLGLKMEEDVILEFEVDASGVPDDGDLLPESAYELKNSIVFSKGESYAILPLTIKNNEVGFRKNFYLPLRISKSSKHIPDPKKSLLLIKVTIKNDYQWNYTSRKSVSCDGRSVNASDTKTTKSYDKDMIILDIFTDYFSTAGNWSYQYGMAIPYSMGIKIIPTQDKRHYKVEFVKTNSAMTGKNWYGYQSPETLEQDPDNESYYDWDYETFHLNYRYRKNDNPEDAWVYVSEILEAQ